MISLDERKKNRWLMLKRFFDVSNGQSGTYLVNMWEVGQELGWDRQTTAATYEYLEGEGLLKAMTLGGGAAITHQGVKEVEEAEEHPERPTLHFPPFVVSVTTHGGAVHFGNDSSTHITTNVAGSPGAVVTSGGGDVSKIRARIEHRIQDSRETDQVKQLLRELTTRIASVDSSVNPEAVQNLNGDLDRLTEEMSKQNPRRKWYEVSIDGIKEAASAVGEIGQPILESASALAKLLLP